MFLLAIAVAILTLPYTLVLLTIQWLKKVSNYKVLFWVVKLKPFFDAYTGPYKDKYHFWPGFLLLVRILLFLAIAANVSKGPILNLTLVCVTAATLFLFSHPGVYKSWLLSLIESFTYFNLILFSIGTAYVLQQNSHKSNSQQDYQKEKTVLVCVGSMFLLFCGIVTWNISQCLGGALYWEKLKVWLRIGHGERESLSDHCYCRTLSLTVLAAAVVRMNWTQFSATLHLSLAMIN